MSKYFLFVIALFAVSEMHAQFIQKDGQCIGIDKLTIGEIKTTYATNITYGDKYTQNHRVFSLYSYGQPGGVRILDILFNSVLLTFDDSDTLVSISLLKFYKKTENLRYEKVAEKYYKQLIGHAEEQLGRKGESKIYYRNRHPAILDKGQEWNNTNLSLKIKHTNTAYHSTIEVSLGCPGH